MQMKLIKSSLALSAAAALGLGSAFIAGPALADDAPVLNEQKAMAAAKSISDVKVTAFGFDGDTLHIGIDGATAESADVEKLKEKYGLDRIEVETGLPAAEAYAKTDAVGGAGYTVDLPSQPGYISGCSAGFAGWDGDGEPVILTAGHCAEDTGPDQLNVQRDTEKPSTANANTDKDDVEYHPDEQGIGPLGEWGYTKFGSPVDGDEVVGGGEGDDIDFAVINVDDSTYDVKPEITDWTTADSDDLSGSTSTLTKVGAHTDGAIKKSGRTTGLTEGAVLPDGTALDGYDFVNIGGRWVHGFGVYADTPFSKHGDSGGGVFQGDTAVGVISGGWDDPIDIGGGLGETNVSWIADLDYSLEQSGQSFTFEDPDAEPVAPDAPVVEDQTIEPNGEVSGSAEAGATVEVSWSKAEADNQSAGILAQAGASGSETVTADDSGAFSLEGPGDEGSYDYTAQIPEDGDTPASDVTEFTVTVEAADDGDDGAEDGTDDGAEDGTDEGNQDGAEDGTDEGNQDGAEDGTDEGNQDGAEDGTDENADSDADGGDAAERALTVDPKQVSAADFVKEDSGVTITAEGFDEGENVSLEVVAGPENVRGITLDQVADENGVATFVIYGTNAADPSAYIGTYDVSVTGADDAADEDPLTGSFEVVADDNGNGGGGSDDSDGGSDLPRTGAELTGLAAGAGLLLVGGAAVVLTMRRAKKN